MNQPKPIPPSTHHLKVQSSNQRSGFLLLEVVLALGIFAIACTGLTIAFSRMADAAFLSQQELRVTQILDSALTEQLSMPTLEEGSFQIPVEGSDVELDVSILPLEELLNKDGEPLQQIYEITIIARWYVNGDEQTRTAKTWRNNLMYQP